jgi:hypothetical protein
MVAKVCLDFLNYPERNTKTSCLLNPCLTEALAQATTSHAQKKSVFASVPMNNTCE